MVHAWGLDQGKLKMFELGVVGVGFLSHAPRVSQVWRGSKGGADGPAGRRPGRSGRRETGGIGKAAPMLCALFPNGPSPEYKAAHKGRPHLDAAWDGGRR